MLFRRFGGIYQMAIDGADGLALIDRLNPALWAITSAPLKDLQCDPAFLAYLDPDGRGRVRVDQLIAARDWLFARLANRAQLPRQADVLCLADLGTEGSEGQPIRRTADLVLTQLRAADRTSVSLAQVRAFRSGYSLNLANGDGVVPPEVIPDAEVAQFVRDVIAVVGGVPDASTRTGVGSAQLDKFLAQAKAYLDWRAAGLIVDGQPNPPVLPWGSETVAAADLVRELAPKIEQYFWQCDLLRQEPGAAPRLHLAPEEIAKLAIDDASKIQRQLAEAPLAPPRADGLLAADAAANPYYEVRLRRLRETVLSRALGHADQALTRDLWQTVLGVFAPYWTWQARKPSEPFDGLDPARLAAVIQGPLPGRLREFISADAAAAPELAQLANLEKLVLYQRWLLEFANNFVNLSSLFDPRKRALFEMGTLVIDGRRLEFTVKVLDRAAHKKTAAESRVFVVYAAICDQDGKAPLFEVAAPVTRGERGRLVMGKRGIFLGVDRKVYDAQIVDVIENPIGLGEAIQAPFRRLGALAERKLEEFASRKAQAAETAAVDSLAKAGQAIAVSAPGGKLQPANMIAMLAGGGFALAAVGSAVAYAFSALSRVGFLDALKAVFYVVALIVTFNGLLGWFKLRRRDMGVLLEANGWAVNLRIRLTTRLSRLFNRRPGLPKGHHKQHVDLLVALRDEPDLDAKVLWVRVGVIAAAVLLLISLVLGYLFWGELLTLLRHSAGTVLPRPSGSE